MRHPKELEVFSRGLMNLNKLWNSEVYKDEIKTKTSNL